MCVRFSSTNEYGDHKWKFYIVDSLNNSSFHNEIESTLKSKSKLHSMFDLSDNNIGIFKFKSIPVKQQSESECGCRLALHMYLTCISTSIEDF